MVARTTLTTVVVISLVLMSCSTGPGSVEVMAPDAEREATAGSPPSPAGCFSQIIADPTFDADETTRSNKATPAAALALEGGVYVRRLDRVMARAASGEATAEEIASAQAPADFFRAAQAQAVDAAAAGRVTIVVERGARGAVTLIERDGAWWLTEGWYELPDEACAR